MINCEVHAAGQLKDFKASYVEMVSFQPLLATTTLQLVGRS